MRTRLSYYRAVRRQAFAGLAVTIGLGGAFVLANYTAWTLPAPAICGLVSRTGQWQRVNAATSFKSLQDGEKLICIDEIVSPYSASSGSITVGLRLTDPGGHFVTKETQMFVASNFGPTKFNDTPGDWIVYQTNSYNPWGILQAASNEPHTSWSSNDLSPEIEREIWRMVQLDVAPWQVDKRHSLSRFLGGFLSLNGLNLIALLLLFYGILLLVQLLHEKRRQRHQVTSGVQESEQAQLNAAAQSKTSQALISVSCALAIASLSGVAHLTNWLLPRPFLCRHLSAPPQLAMRQHIKPLTVCYHEIHSFPHKELKTAVLGMSFQYGNVQAYSAVRFFIALPSDKMGFQDVPGSWHFLNTFYFNKRGILIKNEDRIVTSWMGSDIPQYYNSIIWHDVAYVIQHKYPARRLSIGSKFTEVSQSYLSLILAVLVGLWTCIKFVELLEIKYDLLPDDS
jgi:hypothetical protein